MTTQNRRDENMECQPKKPLNPRVDETPVALADHALHDQPVATPMAIRPKKHAFVTSKKLTSQLAVFAPPSLGCEYAMKYNDLVAFIEYIDGADASPTLLDLYDRFRGPAGFVDNILRIHGSNPPSLTAHFCLYETLMLGRSELSRIRREMIAVVVSALNKCHY